MELITRNLLHFWIDVKFQKMLGSRFSLRDFSGCDIWGQLLCWSTYTESDEDLIVVKTFIWLLSPLCVFVFWVGDWVTDSVKYQIGSFEVNFDGNLESGLNVWEQKGRIDSGYQKFMYSKPMHFALDNGFLKQQTFTSVDQLTHPAFPS